MTDPVGILVAQEVVNQAMEIQLKRDKRMASEIAKILGKILGG